ncbi:MAG: PTS fructose transporter subunit IIA [delta proteobacterium MLS_D]|jgi:nitrogen PTS system EIIA component|nr:MAG: PTS fructose transporter subunit IIA [delta proteobacterium MLS_D]
MNIREIIEQNYIVDELKSKTKREVLKELTRPFAENLSNVDSNGMVEVLLDREKLGSTGIGDGVAIPHGKMTGLDQLVVSFGRSSEGVEFDALDGKPVNIFFLLMAPDNSAGKHLKALAKISRMLKDAGFRKELMEADSKQRLYSLIVEKDKMYP